MQAFISKLCGLHMQPKTSLRLNINHSVKESYDVVSGINEQNVILPTQNILFLQIQSKNFVIFLIQNGIQCCQCGFVNEHNNNASTYLIRLMTITYLYIIITSSLHIYCAYFNICHNIYITLRDEVFSFLFNPLIRQKVA